MSDMEEETGGLRAPLGNATEAEMENLHGLLVRSLIEKLANGTASGTELATAAKLVTTHRVRPDEPVTVYVGGDDPQMIEGGLKVPFGPEDMPDYDGDRDRLVRAAQREWPEELDGDSSTESLRQPGRIT